MNESVAADGRRSLMVIGVFADVAAARTAVAELKRGGIADDALRLVERAPAASLAVDDEPDRWRLLLAELFGADAVDAHAGRHAAAVPHGGAMLLLRVAAERADEVRERLAGCGALEVEQRVAAAGG